MGLGVLSMVKAIKHPPPSSLLTLAHPFLAFPYLSSKQWTAVNYMLFLTRTNLFINVYEIMRAQDTPCLNDRLGVATSRVLCS